MTAKPRRERRKRSLEAELRSLNAIYRWDLMLSSPQSPSSSSSKLPKESLRSAAAFDSVTKRSRRRRRRGYVGIDSMVNLESSGVLPEGCGAPERGRGEDGPAGLQGSEDFEGGNCSSGGRDGGRASRRCPEEAVGAACEPSPDAVEFGVSGDGDEENTIVDCCDAGQARADGNGGTGGVVPERRPPVERTILVASTAGDAATADDDDGDRKRGALNVSDSDRDGSNSGNDGSVHGDELRSTPPGKNPGERGRRPRTRGKRRIILDDDSDDEKEEDAAPSESRGNFSSLVTEDAASHGFSPVSKTAAAVVDSDFTAASEARETLRRPRRLHRVLIDEDSDSSSDGDHGATAAATAAATAVAVAGAPVMVDNSDASTAASTVTVSPVHEDRLVAQRSHPRGEASPGAGDTGSISPPSPRAPSDDDYGPALEAEAGSDPGEGVDSDELTGKGRRHISGGSGCGDGGGDTESAGSEDSSGNEGYGSPDAAEEWNITTGAGEPGTIEDDEGTAAPGENSSVDEDDASVGGGDADAGRGEVGMGGFTSDGGDESRTGSHTGMHDESCMNRAVVEPDNVSAVDSGSGSSTDGGSNDDDEQEEGDDEVLKVRRRRRRSVREKTSAGVAGSTGRRVVVESSDSESDLGQGVLSPRKEVSDDSRREDRLIARSSDSDAKSKEKRRSSSGASGSNNNDGHEVVTPPASSEAGARLPRRRRAKKVIVEDDDSSSDSSRLEDAVSLPSSVAGASAGGADDPERGNSFAIAVSSSNEHGHEGAHRRDTSGGARRKKRLASAASFASPSKSEAGGDSDEWAGSSTSASSPCVRTPANGLRRSGSESDVCCGGSDDSESHDDDNDDWSVKPSPGGRCPKARLDTGGRGGRTGRSGTRTIEGNDKVDADSPSASPCPCPGKAAPKTNTKASERGRISDEPPSGREVAGGGRGAAGTGGKGWSRDVGDGRGGSGEDKLQGVAFSRARDRCVYVCVCLRVFWCSRGLV